MTLATIKVTLIVEILLSSWYTVNANSNQMSFVLITSVCAVSEYDKDQ